ncbi:MBL fold metallo-hydrolase [Actinophytocola oryzae]|uniref:Glyoxylase-like metal-dependent hydrolase (Beta-lactamase superfamily II) n=1 Tax=Actinophytocola oryzae TaxID=502181 RepID=A0A4R7W2S8_9PSEU|nr:MBL fold metallo-hydrolase [Actinophytocola oryzae]TDV56328.1 glyoxylase-like metal-dependent hydrolase (beta-lactamase superfamily II) [Actinophytocola oryzae]
MDLVPGPAEVAGGVWSVALPFPNPLGFAFSYVVPVAGGVVVVDAGWDSDTCWEAFLAGLASAGAGLDDLVGVVITHVHPDHYGLAERIRATTAAWIAVHPAERPRIAAGEHDRERAITDMAEWLRQAGAPASEFAELESDAADMKARISMVVPEHDLLDGDAVPGTDGSLIAVHTPGHTPGHLCFHDQQRRLLFTGDHILPRVTPNVSKRPQSDVDPLRDFLASLRKVGGYGDVAVLPGHEWTFHGLDDRLDYLLAHHEERLTEIEAAVGAGAGTVWEVVRAVTWSRPFERLRGRARRSAIGETFSHLYRLAAAQRVQWVPGCPDRWLPATTPPAL